jgi:hypothetical protein
VGVDFDGHSSLTWMVAAGPQAGLLSPRLPARAPANGSL